MCECVRFDPNIFQMATLYKNWGEKSLQNVFASSNFYNFLSNDTVPVISKLLFEVVS